MAESVSPFLLSSMQRVQRRIGVTLVAACAVLAACASQPAATTTTPETFVMGQAGATARARADSARLPYTKADIEFMSGMIHHHAQAILISRWAPSHGASPSVIRLTERIINAQSDEIVTMQMWLRDRNQDAMQIDSLGNVTSAPGATMSHGEHAGHSMSAMSAMPGMLNDAQLRELDAARGREFDRLLLTYMMQHHRGAITMVRTLFSNQGAGQDETVFKFAADVEVDQSTEIKRMLTMLLEMGFAPPAP
jgi:uncharacterized protein (DUF305 family)